MKTFKSMKSIVLSALVCAIAAVSFTGAFAQAPGHNGMQMPPMGGPQGQQMMGQDMSGQNGMQMPPMGGPQSQQMTGQNMSGQNGMQMPPMGGPSNNTGRLQDSIDNVSDSDTQSALQTLLDAYRSILEEEKNAEEDEKQNLREAAHDALEDLLTALKEAGIEMQPEQEMPFNSQMGPGEPFDGSGRMGGPQNEGNNLQNLIDEVSDSDTKAALQTLLDAFESAMETERNADEDERESLRSVTAEAMEALITAMKEAGIETDQPQEFPFNGQMGPGQDFNGNGQMPQNQPDFLISWPQNNNQPAPMEPQK